MKRPAPSVASDDPDAIKAFVRAVESRLDAPNATAALRAVAYDRALEALRASGRQVSPDARAMVIYHGPNTGQEALSRLAKRCRQTDPMTPADLAVFLADVVTAYGLDGYVGILRRAEALRKLRANSNAGSQERSRDARDKDKALVVAARGYLKKNPGLSNKEVAAQIRDANRDVRSAEVLARKIGRFKKEGKLR